jgi:hypothetical protein
LGSNAPPLSHRLFIRLICGDPSDLGRFFWLRRAPEPRWDLS